MDVANIQNRNVVTKKLSIFPYNRVKFEFDRISYKSRNSRHFPMYTGKNFFGVLKINTIISDEKSRSVVIFFFSYKLIKLSI